jgi:hypothetical protein
VPAKAFCCLVKLLKPCIYPAATRESHFATYTFHTIVAQHERCVATLQGVRDGTFGSVKAVKVRAGSRQFRCLCLCLLLCGGCSMTLGARHFSSHLKPWRSRNAFICS